MRNIVENTLAEVYAPGLSYNSLIDENLDLELSTPKKVEDNPLENKATEIKEEIKNDSNNIGLMSNLLNAFGGEVIN